jgi:hypothetical protein
MIDEMSSSSKRVHPRKARGDPGNSLGSSFSAGDIHRRGQHERHTLPPAFVTSARAGINGGDARTRLGIKPIRTFP